MISQLIGLAAKLKATPEWEAYQRRLQLQRDFITKHCPTISDSSDVERLRTALMSVKPCKTCDRKSCPKTAAKYTFVGEVTWWNEHVYLRWVRDCRDDGIKVPTVQDYNRQILNDQLALQAMEQRARDLID